MKTRTTESSLIALLLACVGFFPTAQAVITDPEGYFPGWNTAEGQSALFSLTTGLYNTALGGAALYSNTTGNNNTAVGINALFHNTTGLNNTAMGPAALFYNSTGAQNTATGYAALRSNSTGTENTANGYQALYFNTGGIQNTATGWRALYSNTTSYNTANGHAALYSNTTGDRNIALGYLAGHSTTTASNVICIGAGIGGFNVNNSCYIGEIWQRPGGSQAVYVNAAGKLGQLVSSRRFKDEVKAMENVSEVIYGLKPVSFRYKAEIEPSRPLSFGLVAEEVERIAPNLVTRGSDGKVNSVRYEAVNAMLLNEFLKEHRKVAEQEATITQLKKDFRATVAQLTARLDEQAAQIQKVNDQFEISKGTSNVVLNNP